MQFGKSILSFGAAALISFTSFAADEPSKLETGADGLPVIQLPDINPVDLNLLPTDIVKVPEVRIIDPEVVAAQPAAVNVPKIDDFSTSLNDLIEQYKAQLKLIKDQRNLSYDKNLEQQPKLWERWRKIYESELKELKAAPRLAPWQLRMVAEAKLPKTSAEEATLDQNLAFYKSRGFNAVLLTFNCTEDLRQLLALQAKIHKLGFATWIAYSNIDDLNLSVFEDPDKLQRYFAALGENADGMLLGWRRTSAHLFLMDEHYAQFTYEAALSANPDLKVLGESYIGETAKVGPRQTTLTVNNPRWISGTVLAGVGFSQVNAQGALSGVFSPVKELPRVAIVVGDQPYYLTTNKNALNFEQNFECKLRIEKEFRNAGCAGTIVCHGDSGIYESGFSREITDSLCRVN